MPHWALLILVASLLLSCSKGGGGAMPDEQGAPVDDSLFKSPGDGSAGAVGVDPLASEAWHLDNRRQKTFSSANAFATASGEDARLEDSHEAFNRGEGVRVGISDNGTEIMHEDLYFNIDQAAMRNYSADDPNFWLGEPIPGSGAVAAHGTAVTGIIGALKNNSRGSYGIAPEATLIPFKFVGVSGENYFAKEIDQASGLIDVFNYSYGRGTCAYRYLSPDYLDQLRYGATEQRAGKGSLYVKAAGNEFVSYLDDCQDDDSSNDNDFYFGNAAFEEDNSSPFVLVVGGFNAAGYSASYSTPGSVLWISAPAGEYGDTEPAILTTDLMGCKLGFSNSKASENSFENGDPITNPDCHYTSTMNGTSAAAPMVSGAIALILAERPELSWRDVKDILARSARPLKGGLTPTSHPSTYGGNTYYPSPKDHIYLEGWKTNQAGLRFHNWYGFGGLDIRAALELTKNRTDSLPALYETADSGGHWKYLKSTTLAIPDNEASGVEDTIEVSEDLVVEAVQIRVSATHGRASDLGVELISPGGTKSQLMLINSNILDKNLGDIVLLSNAFYGESGKGEWKLKVIDGRTGVTGRVTRWGVNIFGHSKNEALVPLTQVAADSELRKSLAKIYPVSALTESSTKKVQVTVATVTGQSENKSSAFPTKTTALHLGSSVQLQTAALPLKFKAEKRKPSSSPESVTSCLLQDETKNELLLVRGPHKQVLLAQAGQIVAFFQDESTASTLLMVKNDQDPLVKVLLFDAELKLSDENFLEELQLGDHLSVGRFEQQRAFFVHQGGVSSLDLKTMELAHTTKLEGLKALQSDGHHLKAWSTRETFEFDHHGVITARAARASSLHENETSPVTLPWCKIQKEQIVERTK